MRVRCGVIQLYLDVGGILVGLVGGGLQLLADPGLDLIHVTAELLQGLRLAQLGALFNHLGLQPAPPAGWKAQCG